MKRGSGLKDLATVTTEPAARLGLSRVLVGGFTLAYLGLRRETLRKVVRTDPKLFAPVGPVKILRRPMRPQVADVLNDATLVSAALFTLGVGHRLTGPLHSALLTWTASYRNSWSMIYHTDNTLVAHTVVLAVSPAADAVSLSALRRGAEPADHPRYAWALQLMNAVPAVAYLLAGIAKLAQPRGWTWARGDAMRRQVALDGIRKQVYGSRVAPAAFVLYPHRKLWTAAAIGTLVLEPGAPVALVLNRRLGRLWALSMFGMHWGVEIVMGIHFPYQLSGVSFAAWLDLERVLRIVRRR
jgi:hypothetical protein